MKEKEALEFIHVIEEIFRGICQVSGYDLKEEDEANVLNDTFWAWMAEYIIIAAEECNVSHFEVLETTARTFASSKEARLAIFMTYANRLVSALNK